MIITIYLILVVLINIYGVSASIVETDGTSYIQIASDLNPTKNTSYGHIQINNQMTIQFNLIYHDHTSNNYIPSNSSNSLQNIFRLESINTNNNNNNNNQYCTQYPSMWLSPSDNSLYFSLLNDVYCLQSFDPITPNIPYSITIQYYPSSIYIAINDTIIINKSYSIPIHDNNDIINLYISDISSDPACVTLSNFYIETSSFNDSSTETIIFPNTRKPINSTNPPNRILNHIQHSNLNNNADDTIFMIEIAVLTVFAFACLGVIIASFCLVKMRQSTKAISRDLPVQRHYNDDNDNDNNNSNNVKVIQIYRRKPAKSYDVVHTTKILSNSSDDELRHIAAPKTTSSYHHDHHQRYKQSKSKSRGSQDSSTPSYHDKNHYDESKRHRKRGKSNNSDCYPSSHSKGGLYVEALRTNRSKSEHIYKKKKNHHHHHHHHHQHHQQHPQQIPKYEASKTGTRTTTRTTTFSSLACNHNSINMISSKTTSIPSEIIRAPSALQFFTGNNMNKQQLSKNNISPIIANCPQLPKSPIINKKKHIIDNDMDVDDILIARKDSDPNLMDRDSDKASEYKSHDVYDLNSDEGDDIKLRRAVIQSQRAVASALHLDPLEAPRNDILNECDEDNDGDDEEEAMDGMPVIHSIYDTIKPIKDISSTTKSHSSIEDMFIHSDENMSDDPEDTKFTNRDGIRTGGSILMDDDHCNNSNNSSVGPSIPSLATEITLTNRLSTITNKTGLTTATKRLYFQNETTKIMNKHKSITMSDDINNLSSGDESTCITVPIIKGMNSNNTISTLSLAVNNNGNYQSDDSSINGLHPISKSMNDNPLFQLKNKYKHSRDTDSLSDDYEITINNDDYDDIDDDIDIGIDIDNDEKKDNDDYKNGNNSSVLSHIKRIKRALSIGHSSNNKYLNSGSDDKTNTGSDTETVSYQNISVNSMDNSLNITTNKIFNDKIPRFISEKQQYEKNNNNDKGIKIIKKIKNTGIAASKKIRNSISYFDEKNNSDDDDNDNDASYEWIKCALKCCDENCWEQYFKNFKKHKVDEKRLTKLHDVDWRELIPAIGPRNDFREMWNIRQINTDIL